MSQLRIALIGNPNCGKTTLFNRLTGSRQRVGNWPGVTVERKTGRASWGDVQAEIIDLPGIYSIMQEAPGIDERIAQDYLASGEFDLIVNIVDASNLQRNLVLTGELIDRGYPLVVALNMLDVAEREGMHVNAPRLTQELGAPVVPIIASRGTGIDSLLALVASRGAAKVRQAEAVREGISPSDAIVAHHYRAERIVAGVVTMAPVAHTMTERIDRWVLNRWLGVPIFLAVMYLMFTLAINLGAVFIDFFDIVFGAVVVEAPRHLLESIGTPAWLTVLLADGLGGGLQLVATFIPVIGFLFLCLSVVESSGYMARAAFVVDRLMARIGLPGNAFVPLIVGFGCNVPSVMATRTLGKESERLLTMAMAPFMSCGARLTVYALFAAALFPQSGQNIVFLLYIVGIVMAVLTGWLFRHRIFAGQATASVQEMPAYHLPVWRNILLTSWFRLKAFLFRAGRTIVLVVVGLNFVNSIGTDGSFGNEGSEQSVLSVVGKAITPAFAPLGVAQDNWPATVGLFTGLFAKEAVVGTLDALYSGGDESRDASGPPSLIATGGEALASVRDNTIDLLGNLGDPLGIGIDPTADAEGASGETLTNMASAFGTQFAAFCYLVFILLYAPCVAVLGAMAKEAGWRYMALTFCWTTALAYVTATCIYQVGTFMQHPLFSSLWLLGCAAFAALAVWLLGTIGTKTVPKELIAVTQVG